MNKYKREIHDRRIKLPFCHRPPQAVPPPPETGSENNRKISTTVKISKTIDPPEKVPGRKPE